MARPRRTRRRSLTLGPALLVAALAFLLAVAGAWGFGDSLLSPDAEAGRTDTGGDGTLDAPPGGPSLPENAPTEPTAAAELLAQLPVKGRAAKTGYDRRERFGDSWYDIDRNGCDTRNDILARDLVDITLDSGCRVLTGRLADPYTGTTVDFLRGEQTSPLVQIDHVVALSDAWQKGAQQLTPAERATFANDPLNLLAVDGATNSAKGDADAATWLPPDRSYRCAYVARQVAVKATYALWVTPAEHDAMAAVLNRCPGEIAPVSPFAAASRGAASAPEVPAGPPRAETVGDDGTGADAFADCAAARRAGSAPVRVGDPGYSAHLDGDGDGVACE